MLTYADLCVLKDQMRRLEEEKDELQLATDQAIALKEQAQREIQVSSYIPVLILVCMCPHTVMYVSSYCYICVLILLCMCRHTVMYVSSYCYTCVLVLLYMCPHTVMYVYVSVLRHRYDRSHEAVSPHALLAADMLY